MEKRKSWNIAKAASAFAATTTALIAGASSTGATPFDAQPTSRSATRFAISDPAPQDHHVYAGYGVDYENSGDVTRVSSDWLIPSVAQYSGDSWDDIPSVMSSWVGDGGPSADGSPGTPLVQAGSWGAAANGYTTNYGCFWMVAGITDLYPLYDANGNVLECNAHDHIHTAISVSPQPNNAIIANFTIWNQTTNQTGTASFQFSGNYGFGNIARWVTERTTKSPWVHDLPDFYHIEDGHLAGGYTFHNNNFDVWFPYVGGTKYSKNLADGHSVEWSMKACRGNSHTAQCLGSGPMGPEIGTQGNISSSSAFSSLRNDTSRSCVAIWPATLCNNPPA